MMVNKFEEKIFENILFYKHASYTVKLENNSLHIALNSFIQKNY